MSGCIKRSRPLRYEHQTVHNFSEWVYQKKQIIEVCTSVYNYSEWVYQIKEATEQKILIIISNFGISLL